MPARSRVALIFGGRSVEHEISILSARNIFAALSPEKYDVVPIAINREGRWLLTADISVPAASESAEVTLVPGGNGRLAVTSSPGYSLAAINVAFPALHGPLGEDGTVQGLLRLANVAFVGSSTLGAAVSMDKDISKRLLRDAGIRIPRFITVKPGDDISFDKAMSELGHPLFVKPACLGSSVGTHKVADASSYADALMDAFRYDNKVLVEEFVLGREIECAILETAAQPIASVPGEIIPASRHAYYSYEAKYMDKSGAELVVPASLPPQLIAEVQGVALKAFSAMCGEGLARVDFFLRSNGQILLNEMNAMPGFTSISMYPRLWAASGLSQEALMDELIERARARFAREQALRTQLSQIRPA